MQFKRKLLLTTVISASFMASSASAKIAYSENALSTQTILAQVGYMQPAQVNGYMDQATRDSVASFQQANGLPATGMIDPKTAEILNNAYNGATAPQPAQLAPTPAPAPIAAPAVAPVYSSNALAIQQILYRLGYLKAAPNGYLDAQTRAAIIQFQTTAGLAANGEIDEATAAALNSAYTAGSVYQNAGVKRSAQLPYVKNDSTFAKNKWAWAAAGVGVAGGAAVALSAGGGSSSTSAPLSLAAITPTTLGITSNDAGNQTYNGSFVAANLNNPAAGTPANFLLGDAAVADSLPLMNAQFSQARGYDGRAYHRAANGALVNSTFDDYAVVAVIDSGIDFTHADLDANILVADGVTCTGGTCVRGGQDTGGHGTEVAGVIAAEDNTIGTVGVAPQAKLLSIANDLTTSSIVAGYNYLNNKGVDVINNSYGSLLSLVTAANAGTQTGTVSAGQLRSELTTVRGGTTWEQEIQQAIGQHSILVWAAGNESSDQPTYESSMPYYFDGTVNAANTNAYNWTNNWVTAVSVNDSLGISSFSNKCGIAADYCLAAPGEVHTTTVGGGYADVEGTSFAAPNVSGALAVLLGAYPHLSPEQVLNILFETATDLGVAGTDAIYGRGLVNLDAATNPTGNSADWTLALNNASFTSFSGSGIRLSSAFGDAMAQNNQRIMFQDKFGKDYQISLSSLVGTVQEQTTNQERLAEFGKGSFAQEVSLGKNSDLSFTLNPEKEGNLRSALSDISTREQNKFLLNQSFSPSLNATLGYNVNAADMLGYSALAESNKAHLQVSDAFKNPYLNLTEYANGASAGYEFANFGARVAGYEAKNQQEEYAFSDGNKTAGNLAEVYYANDDFTVSLQAGSARETNTFLGSEAGGALELDSETPTYFAGIAASYSPMRNVAIKANYNTGTTKLNSAASSLISDVSDVESDSFAIGLIVDNIYAERDSFGFSVSQPLRISSASAYATLPEDVNVDGSILYQDAQLNLSPAGREMDLEAYYAVPLSGESQLSLGSMIRHEPNHVQDAADEGLLLMKYKAAF